MTFKTEQEAFWAGEFGTASIQRNQGDAPLAANLDFFQGKGYLAGTSVYACIDHTLELVAQFLAELDPVFALIRQCEDGRDVKGLLKRPVCHGGFKRLN